MTQRPFYYRWRNGAPEPVTDGRAFNVWRHDMDDPVSPEGEVPTPRHVAYTEWPDDVRVSTVFLGYDAGYGNEVLLFETCVFYAGSPCHGFIERYTDRDDALVGHGAVVQCVEVVRAHIGEPDLTLPYLLELINGVGRRTA